MKPFDLVLIVLSLSLTLGTAWVVFTPGNAPLQVEIQTDGGQFTYPIDQDRTLELTGPLGHTDVQIRNHQVWVAESACQNKVCVSMGKIHASGQWVACLPNHIFVRISGGAPATGGVDVNLY